ncbi:hypothetical protein DPEC_G00326330 [Dallia pectoralis]|uniref:Uncharacterized protein n=1 Tax=Dallia pectoralis TaxID=75939 RepID=A0ACC2F7T9_DALPE|nr:hypothetical protein DPEC_G00326330 [Dallia pectoralis]
MSTQADPPVSGTRQELRGILQGAEMTHRADILTYCGGHLNPNTLAQPRWRKTKRPIWEPSVSSPPGSVSNTTYRARKEVSQCAEEEEKEDRCQGLQQETKNATTAEKFIEAMFDFVAAKGLKPGEQESQEAKTREPGEESHSGTYRGTPQGVEKVEESRSGTTPRMVLDPCELFLVHPRRPTQSKPTGGAEKMRTDRYWFSQSYLGSLTKKDQLMKMRQFDRQVLGTEDLKDKDRMRGSKAAEKYERKLQKELEKLSDQSRDCLDQIWSSRKRLGVFSDVFNDICKGSSVFGDILREIKTDYDLYMNYLLDLQMPLNNMSQLDGLGILGAEDLEEAGNQVSRLEVEARRALEENDRVRNEFQNAPDRFMEISDDERPDNEATLPDQMQPEEGAVSFSDKVQRLRLQVWMMWGEVQILQKEIKEKMVSMVPTGATERCIRDSKAEIIRLQTSNERIRNTSKDLENNINMILGRARVSEDEKVQVWDKIWSTMENDNDKTQLN